MGPINRRDFLKSSAIAAVFSWMDNLEAGEIKRRSDLKEGVAVPGKPLPPPSAKDEADALRFLVIGDWGWHGAKKPKEESAEDAEKSNGELRVAKAMGEFAKARRPDFVLSVGDNFYPNGVDSPGDIRWEKTFVKPFSAPSLQIPWYAALGNHDYRGSVQAQIDHSKSSPRWRMPDRHYAFSQTSKTGVTARFFVLDTNPFHKLLHKGGHSDVASQDIRRQLAWLDRKPGESGADWKIVVGHHPVFTGGVFRDMKETELDNLLPPLLKKHGVRAYLCGHEHDARHIERDGIHFIVSGNGGDLRPTGATQGTRFAESSLGFSCATLTRDKLRVDFVDAEGACRHTAEVSRH